MASLLRLIWDGWREMEANSTAWRSLVSILLVALCVCVAWMFGAFAAFGEAGFTTPDEVNTIVGETTKPIRKELTEQRKLLETQQQKLDQVIALQDQSLQEALEMKVHNARKSQCQALNADPRNQRAADAEERILIQTRQEYFFRYGRTVDIRPCEEY